MDLIPQEAVRGGSPLVVVSRDNLILLIPDNFTLEAPVRTPETSLQPLTPRLRGKFFRRPKTCREGEGSKGHEEVFICLKCRPESRRVKDMEKTQIINNRAKF